MKISALMLVGLVTVSLPIGMARAQATTSSLGQAQAELNTAKYAIAQEDARFAAALHACNKTIAPSRCTEREQEKYRQSKPVLQKHLHVASQKLRDIRAEERARGQARRIENQATREVRPSTDPKMSRYAAKMAKHQAEQSPEAQAKRASSVQRYNAKIARHQAKMARAQGKRATISAAN